MLATDLRNLARAGARRRLLCVLALCAVGASCAPTASYPEPPRRGDDLFIAASHLTSGAPVFFSYAKGKAKVRFFVLKTDEGVFAFLDACESCSPRKLGYKFEDGRLVCRACNQQFAPSEVAHGFGGCYPIRIPGRGAADGYLIPVAELEKQVFRF